MKATTNKSSHQLDRESLNKPLLDRDGSDFEKDDGISKCRTVDNKIGILIDTNLNDSNSSFSLTGANVMASCVLAAAGCAASAVGMTLFPVVIIFVASGLCCINSLLLISSTYSLATYPKLRSSLNMLSSQINEFRETNDILSRTVLKLENEVEDLKISEHRLNEVVEQRGTDVKSLVAFVKENEEVLDQMKASCYNLLCCILRESFVAELVKVIIRSDRDNDMKIDLEDAPYLVLSLNIQLEPHGIQVDTDLFVHMLQKDNSFENILRFCKDVLYPEIALKQQADKEAAAAAALAEEQDQDDFFLEGYLGDAINRQSSVSEKFRSFIREMSNLRRNVWSASPKCSKSMFPSVSEGVRHTIGKPLMRRVQNRFVDGLVFDVG